MQRVLESLFSVEGEFVYVFDRDLRYVFVSGAGARAVGMTPEQMLGKTWPELLGFESFAPDRARIDGVIATKQPARSIRSVTDPDGRTRSYEYVISPIVGDAGDVELVVWCGRDVTARAVAELHATQLQLLSQRLAATLSREEIANIVIDQLHELLGANASVAYFMRTDGTLELAAHRGLPQQTAVARATVSLDTPVPLAAAARTRTLLTYETRDAVMRDYPNLAGTASEFEAVCAVPLALDQRLFGAIALSFARPKLFEESLRRLLRTFALQCAQALERARLYAEERRARKRLEILADTSDRLSRARLDLQRVLETVCREVATRLPESCTISLVNASGTHLELAASHHIDPAVDASIRMTLGAAPVAVGEGTLGRVVATGHPVLLPVVPFEQLIATLRPEYRAHLERYPISSLIVVPLRVAERVIGTLAASRVRGRAPFTTDDERLLQELADRAAFAIENARLFEAEREARHLRDEFLSIAGHELRTPLAALLLQVESLQQLVRKGALADHPGLLEERLDKATRSVARLDQLIAQLLDVAQLTAGRLSLVREQMDLRELIGEIVERFAEQARRAGSTLDCDAGPPIVGHWDRGRLDQVITNLVDNAIKYGEGKPISIAVSQDRDRVRLAVRDRGMGIAPEARERVFGRFERAVSSRHYGGLGLGLWISRQIVEALGGTITCADTHPAGTTFVVELPTTNDA